MVDITKEVCSEVYDIIQHMEINLCDKIPNSFINLIKKNIDGNYLIRIDYSKKIYEQNLQKGTRVILSLIYRDYLCSAEEKEKIIKKDNDELKKIQENLREKYNPDNIFINKSKIKKEEQTEEKSLTIVQEEKYYHKIFNIIKLLLRRTKKG